MKGTKLASYFSKSYTRLQLKPQKRAQSKFEFQVIILVKEKSPYNYRLFRKQKPLLYSYLRST